MFIHEAASAAMALDLCITRTAWDWKNLKIKPTNTTECCIMFSPRFKNKPHVPRWNPNANDLLANDWVLVP